jgi:hypothetical protein
MSTATLSLTEAEIALIEAKRLQDAADAAKKLAENQVKAAKAIDGRKEDARKFLAKSLTRESALNIYFNTMRDSAEEPNAVKMITGKLSKVFDVRNYLGDGKYETIWSENFTYDYSQLFYKGREIYVEEHTVSTGYRDISHGFKMRIDYNDRLTKDPKNVIKKIDVLDQELINKDAYERRAENKKLNVEDTLKEKFPTGYVEQQKLFHSSHRRGGNGYYTTSYIVKFENGIQLNANENGELYGISCAKREILNRVADLIKDLV